MGHIERAAQLLRTCDGVLIMAGAGMGVDSGLPDFRGPEGFWRAYPPFRSLGLHLEDMSNPQWFYQDPPLAWGFFGHRYGLYTKATPHDGFRILLDIGRAKERAREGNKPSFFVFTSNVDGQFQRQGFEEDRIVECHGSIHFMQCTDCRLPQCREIYPAEDLDKIQVDETTMRASSVPQCRGCGTNVARPNILMFGDYGWLSERTDAQYERYEAFLAAQKGSKLAVVEFGAGLHVPTVRRQSE